MPTQPQAEPLQVGAKAPSFNLPDQDGEKHKLADYKGEWLLIYFYPKDNTPGCILEACGVRDQIAAFKKRKLNVIGVSPDSVASHRKFADKFELQFPLLADEDKQMVSDYGVYGPKKFMGREFLGVHRTSYLIDPKGKIAAVYAKVKPKEHADWALAEHHNQA
jgi:peroxiredoxin Q/BCP